MDFSQTEVKPGIWLDSRRAAFLEQSRSLVIADLHLGYAWAHRFHGQLLPVRETDPWAERLAALRGTYQPARIVILGDVVHQAVPVPELKNDLVRLGHEFGQETELLLLLGNHDLRLHELRLPITLQMQSSLLLEDIWLSHGDAPAAPPAEMKMAIIGHEHPAISLGDGVTSTKFPCFLVAPKMIVLPAFSIWAAGTAFGTHPLMSPLARQTRFQQALAIMGSRLLPVPLR